MSIKDKFTFAFACVFLAGMMWLMASVMGGWITLAQVIGLAAVISMILGIGMLAVIGIIYFLTVFRANQYAKRLREAGYDVHLHNHEVKDFAIMTLVAMITIPMAISMTKGAYTVYLCIQAGECYKAADWYYVVPLMLGMIWLVGLMSLGSTIKIWRQSFRPLREHHKKMQLGQEVDLPRLH